MEAELVSHESEIQAVQEASEKLMNVSNLGVDQRLKASIGRSEKLAATSGQKLDESLTDQQFLAQVTFTA